MAVSLISDFKIYEPEFQAGMYEALAENVNIFNQASRGAILLTANELPGHYKKEAFFKRISNLISRQDTTSTSDVTPLKLEQNEEVAVKLHLKVGPVDMSLNAFKEAGLETPGASFRLGRLISDAMAKAAADKAIIAANAAVSGIAALINDVTGSSGKATVTNLLGAKQKWGDQQTKLVSWLMHSTPFGDLQSDALSNYKLESVAGVTVATGNISPVVGGSIMISDNSNLVNTGTPNTYNVIGLAGGAVTVEMSQAEQIVIQMVTGKEQLIVRLQGEYAVTIGVDGFAWDTANGGSNPDDTALGTSSNWDKVFTNDKALPLVKLLCQ